MPKQLHIAIISFHSCPLGRLGSKDTGGMNVFIRELAQELSTRNHKVDIFTGAHEPAHEKLIQLNENIRLMHIETGSLVETPKVAFYSYLQNFICGIESFRKSSDTSYDLLYSHYWLSGLAGKQLQTWWHIPHIIMFHTLGAVKNSIGIGTDETELRIESERELVQSCDLIVAATSREEKDLIHYYSASPQKIKIIPCGVNLNLFKPMDRKKVRMTLGLDHQKILLFVGRLDPLKGLEQLLKAFSEIPKKCMANLIVVGGDDYNHTGTHKLDSMAAELGIQSRIHFAGSVEQEELVRYYNAADICIIPSYYESFGMVALESLACGTPVIATDVGAMSEILSQPVAGEIIKCDRRHSLASKITGILNRNSNHIQNIETRRNLVSRYKWSNIADMLLHQYDELTCQNINTGS